jgi:DNA sulfur modification protein DndB
MFVKIITNKTGLIMSNISDHFYTFPAIRGIQAGREYYVSMCPLGHVSKMFKFDEEDLNPELRAQRILNKSRIPEIARYITTNQDNYVFSAITASIEGDVKFIPIKDTTELMRNGTLKIDMSARILVNDGQHRRAAIEQAIKEDDSLSKESIAVVFFIDRGLERSQQMFSDLNRHAKRPSRSLGLLYDHRNDLSKIAKLVALKSLAFKGLVEMEKSTLSERSRKLFTLSSIYTGCHALLDAKQLDDEVGASKLCISFWDEVAKQFPEWEMVKKNRLTAGEIRKDHIHSHGIAIQSIGMVGNQLLGENPKDWKQKLTLLQEIDWSRNNTKIWEGRALVGGRVSKTSSNVALTTNLIKQKLGLTLSPEEKRLEEAHKRG